MIPRSWLCAPAFHAKLLDKAIEASADIALIDLEDSIPADRKADARATLVDHFREPAGVPVAVRINSLATTDGLKDLLFVLDHAIVPSVILLAKANLPAEAALATALFRERACPAIEVFAIIETVSSLWSLRTLTATPPGLSGLVFGAADFAADLGVPPTVTDLRFVKQEIALAARRFGVAAIDSPCFQLRDRAELDLETQDARRLGFAGKIAIHPDQVPLINERFAPSPQAVDDARELIAASERDRASAIQRIGDRMIGPPFLKYARQVLSSAAPVRRR